MPNHKFATTIAICIALVIIAAILAGTASVYSLHRVIRNKDDVVSVHFKNLLKVELLRNSYGKKWTASRNYFMTGQGDFLENMQNSRSVMQAITETLKNNSWTSDELALITAFQNAEDAQEEILQQAVEWRAIHSDQNQFAEKFEEILSEKTEAVEDALAELVVFKTQRLDDASAASSKAATTTLNLVALITLIAIGLSIGMGVFVYRTLLANEQRRQAEDANIILRAVIEGTPDAIYVRDLAGRYLLVNSAAAGLVGKPVSEILGRDTRAVYPPEIARQVIEHDREVIESAKTQTEEEIWQHGGVTRAFHSLKSPYKGPQGNVVGIVGIARDITERLKHEKMISEQQKMIAHSSKMRALGEMASGVAHEINNPLAIIRTKAEILRELANEGEANTEGIIVTAEKIEATVDRMSKIINGLRTFARDSDEDPFVNAKARTIVEETIEFCRERFKNHDIALFVNEIPDALSLECRPTQISQVLLNLLNNAHDAIADMKEKWVKVDVLDLGETVEISVTDSGTGINSELQDKIMQPFFTTKQIGEGTGLGLSISKGLVESHHGNLLLDTKSKNTRFIVSIPKSQINSPHSERRSA
ncbi:MAG: ATP-binding protein [Bdellovibrionia bacterium]